jgi:hypothetical protein
MNLCSKTIRRIYMYSILYSVLSLMSCVSKTPIVKNTNNYHQSPYGAYIELSVQGVQEKLVFKGELIAVDDKKIVVRTLGKNETVRPFALKDILSYKVYYAKNDHEDYNAWGTLMTVSTISHGWFVILTLPINGIVFAFVNSNYKREFNYSKKELPIQELYKFARYPQGLPPHINLNNLNEIMAK